VSKGGKNRISKVIVTLRCPILCIPSCIETPTIDQRALTHSTNDFGHRQKTRQWWISHSTPRLCAFVSSQKPNPEYFVSLSCDCSCFLKYFFKKNYFLYQHIKIIWKYQKIYYFKIKKLIFFKNIFKTLKQIVLR
jgi:hypothetical protein